MLHGRGEPTDRKEVVMPNRVEGQVPGAGQAAQRPEADRAQQAAQAQQPDAPDVDRVEISNAGRERVEAARPTPGEADRGAAADAPGARPPEGGDNAVNAATAQRAEDLREEQEQNAREVANDTPAEPGNMVDVTG